MTGFGMTVRNPDGSDSVIWQGTAEWDEYVARKREARSEEGQGEAAPYQPPERASAADYTPTNVKWLWFGRLASGKLTITDGNPGVGKSARQVDTAARISRGAHWPDCGRGCPGHEPMNVGMVSAEDDFSDTIVPRLMAAGADLTRVFLYSGELSIPDNMGEFVGWMKYHRLAYVSIDPLVAFVSDRNDMNHDQKTRKALGPLQAVIQTLGVAVEGLRHTNKLQNVTSAIDKGSGSRAIGGAARVNLFVARDPSDTDVIVLASAKGNLSKAPDSLAYRIEATRVTVTDRDTGEPVEVEVPTIVWEGVSDLSADDLLKAEKQVPKVQIAVDWLEAVLTPGPMLVRDLERRASGVGISVEGALKTARKRMSELGELAKYQTAEGWWVKLTRAGGSEGGGDHP